MGAGRKTETHPLKEKSKTSWTVNCSVSARNLRKSDIGGVIFGCKHNTIKECLSKQLFGLPAPHFSYIRNIDVGLPLFLFNYSDRQLHGIFEAASPGQLNINPYGWTSDGSDYTPYAAQVRIRIRMQCQPLPENTFKPVIAENYYEPRLFWFELDHNQTQKLISLFLSLSPSPSLSFIASAPLPRNAQNWSCLFKASSVPDGGSIKSLALDMDLPHPDQANAEWESYDGPPGLYGVEEGEVAQKDGETGDFFPSYASVVGSTSTSLPPKKWCDLFEKSTTSKAGKKVEDFQTPTFELSYPGSYQSNTEWESSCLAPCLDGKTNLSEAPADDSGRYNEQLIDEGATNLGDKEHINFKPGFDCSSFSAMTNEGLSERELGEDTEVGGVASEDICFPEAAMFSEAKSSDLQSIVAKILQEVDELKLSQSKQAQQINSLEQDLVESRREIQCLKDRCKMLECGSFPEPGLVNEEESESSDESHPDPDEKVLIVGGNDGSLWLSSLDCYSPSRDLVESLSPMSFIRSHASVAKLNGELYLFGGVYDNFWYDTVESYNPVSNQWVNRPSLNQKKGSLAGVSLNDKIFAIGGRHGVQCFSEVEMLDLDVGRWIPIRSMLDKRFATTAAEINGILYVVGGYDGNDYLKSVERFDPRECSWTRLESMSTRRGCHSLAALNEKLYAIGGYDGNGMVSSVEVFDPRVGSWMMGKPLNGSRGYSGAVVIGDSIYVIGGMNENQETLDTVECYDSHGWQLTNLKAVGKRCFFSAIVL